MVINIGALRGGDDETVKKDIEAVLMQQKEKQSSKSLLKLPFNR